MTASLLESLLSKKYAQLQNYPVYDKSQTFILHNRIISFM